MESSLSRSALNLIYEELRVSDYFKRYRKLFLYCGLTQLLLRFLVIACWIMLGYFVENYRTAIFATASIADIIAASFIISLGCKAMRWLAGRVMALSIFAAVGNISGMVISILFIKVQLVNQDLFMSIILLLHLVLAGLFITTAIVAGYGLRCSICCQEDDEQMDEESLEGFHENSNYRGMNETSRRNGYGDSEFRMHALPQQHNFDY